MFSRKKIRHAQENAAFFIKYFFSLSPFSFVDINNDVFILLYKYMKMVTILLAYITG
jgi:hypothetical protein